MDSTGNSTRPRAFITITRSFITRNILRSGVLDGLIREGFHVDVFFSAQSIPEHIVEEFKRPHITLHALVVKPPSGIHRRINLLKRYLIDTVSTRQTIKYEWRRTVKEDWEKLQKSFYARAAVELNLWLLFLLSRTPFLKSLFRLVERVIFSEKNATVAGYFDSLKPSVVYATSIVSSFDIVFLKEAKRRHVPTVAQPKGWDNVSKEFYPVAPDYLVVTSPVVKKAVVERQRIPEHRVVITGFPQFDWYARTDIARSRVEHLKSKGLDPEKALIFFGSEGIWLPDEISVVRTLYEWVARGEFNRPVQLLIRPHYSNIKDNPYREFNGKPNVVVDTYRIVDFLLEKWDPSVEETIDFVNTMRHSDVTINVASTLSLDAAAVDKPVIELAFGLEYLSGKDISEEKHYGSEHIDWLQKQDGTIRARSLDELKRVINQYLENPTLKAEGRARIRENLCYKIDGNASSRIVETIVKATQHE